jgi:hypothetical protein
MTDHGTRGVKVVVIVCFALDILMAVGQDQQMLHFLEHIQSISCCHPALPCANCCCWLGCLPLTLAHHSIKWAIAQQLQGLEEIEDTQPGAKRYQWHFATKFVRRSARAGGEPIGVSISVACIALCKWQGKPGACQLLFMCRILCQATEAVCFGTRFMADLKNF